MSGDLLEKLLLDGRLLHEIHYQRLEKVPIEINRREPGEIMQSLPADIKVYVELGWLLRETLPIRICPGIQQILTKNPSLAKRQIRRHLIELVSFAKEECSQRSETFKQLRFALEEAERLLYEDGILPEETTKRKVKI